MLLIYKLIKSVMKHPRFHVWEGAQLMMKFT